MQLNRMVNERQIPVLHAKYNRKNIGGDMQFLLEKRGVSLENGNTQLFQAAGSFPATGRCSSHLRPAAAGLRRAGYAIAGHSDLSYTIGRCSSVVEHRYRKPRVTGSIPVSGSIPYSIYFRLYGLF